MATSLLFQRSPLASAAEQLRLLASAAQVFESRLSSALGEALRAQEIRVLQVNLGKVCNQVCSHCHVDAGPDRRESMSLETVELCLQALRNSSIPTLDITGGAPEMNPHFRRLVEGARALGRQVIDRCNLTILLAPRYEDLPEFLAKHRVEIVASLPYYLESSTDAQRGAGVFAKSIEALRRLNEIGYGREGSGLVLNLVYNPVGAFLPPSQAAIERDYRRELAKRHGIVFNNLFTITNMPISRFLEFLVQSGNFEGYMQRLANAFNPAAAAGVMCRTMISVGWDGTLFDCDFNQMLEMPLKDRTQAHIRDFDASWLGKREIATANHCFGCTAGAGSSCGGAVACKTEDGS